MIEIMQPMKDWLKFAQAPEQRTQIGVEIVLDGTLKPKKRQKKQDILKVCEKNPPKYNHIRTFVAVCTAILSSAPGTAPKIMNITNIPTEEAKVNLYFDSPTITKTSIYHAQIFISAIKPFCFLMLNEDFTKWLKTKHMILEVNNLEELMASNVGIFFFSHPRASLAHIQETHLGFLLGKPDAPEMRIKPWLSHLGSKLAYTFLVQTNPLFADQLNSHFEDAS
jgi:hypothetical protein